MIYVTQGHQKSIGLEVFLKAFCLLARHEQKCFTLIVEKLSLIDTLKTFSVTYSVTDQKLTFEGAQLSLILVDVESTHTLDTLEKAISIISSQDILLTLPTSKDQLPFNGQFCAGYTEYFRKKFKDESISMLFAANDKYYLLLSDHIALKEVSNFINSDILVSKVSTTLDGLNKFFTPITKVILSSINPHAGENGLLGIEESKLTDGILSLKKRYALINFIGPVSGDTLHMHDNEEESSILRVYFYHDQGLPIFKDKYRLIGLNVTLGLPFLRMSVDHGTAFELYGKNRADYSGALYLLKSAIAINKRI